MNFLQGLLHYLKKWKPKLPIILLIERKEENSITQTIYNMVR